MQKGHYLGVSAALPVCPVECLHNRVQRGLDVRPAFLVAQDRHKFTVGRDYCAFGEAGKFGLRKTKAKGFPAYAGDPIRKFKVDGV